VDAVCAGTGAGSFPGDPARKTVEMIRDEINQQGGISDQPLDLAIYNDESDSTMCNPGGK